MDAVFKDEFHRKHREADARYRAKRDGKVRPCTGTRVDDQTVLLCIKDALQGYEIELGEDWQKDVIDWFKAEFPKMLKVWDCIENSVEADGEDDDLAEWFVTVFPKMLEKMQEEQEKSKEKGKTKPTVGK